LQHFIGASGSNAVARLLQGILPKHCTSPAYRAEGIGEMSFSSDAELRLCGDGAARLFASMAGMTAFAEVWRRLGAGYVLHQYDVFPAC
jgi:hypothetical protein